MRTGRDFIARHGETVFNAARRLQGDHPHTPLTRAGFAQADEMGGALRQILGEAPQITLWSSTSGRALQTLAVIAEHLDLDWHAARVDRNLVEIHMGNWGGRYYADVIATGAKVIAPGGLLFPAPGGETYPQVADRLRHWLDQSAESCPGDRLILMHGISSRLLRGLMTRLAPHPEFGVPIADGLPQGSVVMIEAGVEQIVHRGAGHAPV